MSDLIAYLKDVFTHWQNWLSGGGFGGAVLIVIFAIERIRKKQLLTSRSYVLVTIFAFMIAASYRAWRDQYHAVMSEEAKFASLTVPHFDGTIDVVSAGHRPDYSRDTMLLLEVSVKNQGAPSSVQIAGCKVHTAGGRDIIAVLLILPPQFPVIFGNAPPREAVVYDRRENFAVRARNGPVPNGGVLSGFFVSSLSGTKPGEIMVPGTVVSVTMRDARGGTFEFKRVVNAQDKGMRVMSEDDMDDIDNE